MAARRGKDVVLPGSARAAAYYRDVREDLQAYGQQAFGWHYGVWGEPRIATHAQALIRSNELLVQGLELTPDSNLLDVGCGVGSFAVWAARKHGCRVTGITICEDHVGRACEIARGHGLEDRCQFRHMDMCRLEFEERSFDAVVNQETFCYSADKQSYLADVHRVLKPGAEWRAVAFSVRPGPLSAVEIEGYEAVRDGFKLNSMLPADEILSLMSAVGFVGRQAIDITSAVLPTARSMIATCRFPLALMRLRLDWLVFSLERQRRAHHQGHYRAGYAYSTGLCDGYFRHFFYAGTRPSDKDHLGSPTGRPQIPLDNE
jgi:tocopherol O-methyltransferase